MSAMSFPLAREIEALTFLTIKTAQNKGKYIRVGDLSGVLFQLTEQVPDIFGNLPIRFRSLDNRVGSPDVSRAIDTLVKSDQVEITHTHSEVYEATPLGDFVQARDRDTIAKWLQEKGVDVTRIEENLALVLNSYLSSRAETTTGRLSPG